MPPTNTQLAKAFYGALRHHPCGSKRVGWNSTEWHTLRLRALIGAALPSMSPDPFTILDVGCGEGHLLTVLKETPEGLRCTEGYHGEDVLSSMVQAAQSRHPEARFTTVDSFSGEQPPADLVLCSGTLNTMTLGARDALFAKLLESLWERSNQVLAIDFALAGRHHGGPGIATYEAAKCLEAARDLTRTVQGLEGVIPGEGILVLSRSPLELLSHLDPTGGLAEARAEMHLRSGATDAARQVLSTCESVRAEVLKSTADMQSGRYLRAEQNLRVLSPHSPLATLHLAHLLALTRRREEAAGLLAEVVRVGGEHAEDAQIQLAGITQARGSQE